MAKDPAFLFYSSDFLTGTMFMTNEQVGLYIRMLAAQHQHGGRIDTNVLRMECDRITNGDTVFAKFKHDEHGSYSERLSDEMDKRKEKSLKASESVKKRWNKSLYERNTNVIRSVNENEDVNVNVNKNINKDINIDFEWFWNEYDKKVGVKEKLKKKWNKLTDEERQNAMNYIDLYKKAVPDKQYRKNPESFLNNKSWNDEIIKSNNNNKRNYYSQRQTDALKEYSTTEF